MTFLSVQSLRTVAPAQAYLILNGAVACKSFRSLKILHTYPISSVSPASKIAFCRELKNFFYSYKLSFGLPRASTRSA